MELGKLQGQWMELLASGKGAEADAFYWKKLFPLAQERLAAFADEMRKKQELPEYGWLIIPAGFEYQYHLLLINALKPKKVFFLCTKEFKSSYLKDIVAKAGLSPENYEVETLDYQGADLSEAYRAVKSRIDLFRNSRVAVDLSRGKRIITSGTALMAAFFGFDMVYIDEQWMHEYRRGLPGSERLVRAKNPFTLFGEIGRCRAAGLFNNHNFSAAADSFLAMKGQVVDPRRFETCLLLAEGYLHWDAFNYPAALAKLREAVAKIRQYALKNIDAGTLELNLQALEVLSKVKDENYAFERVLKDGTLLRHLLLDIYLNAIRRKDQGKFDDSMTRLYRLLEMVSQHRLAEHSIITASPGTALLKSLEPEYAKLTQAIYGEPRDLHHEIGLKEGHMLLFVLKDPLWKDKSVDDLKQFLGTIRLRDTSIIAHGIQLVEIKAFQKIESYAKGFIRAVFQLHKDSLEQAVKKYKLIEL